MNSPLDIAAYIVTLSDEIGEPVTNMKLQKLVYYTYAWYAVEKKEPLFDEEIYAWKYGPVITSIYEAYKDFGADVIKEVRKGNPDALDDFTKQLTEEVFNVYGSKTAIELMNLTHFEAPWRDSFNKDNQHTPIPFDQILTYYQARKEASLEDEQEEPELS